MCILNVLSHRDVRPALLNKMSSSVEKKKLADGLENFKRLIQRALGTWFTFTVIICS